MSTKTLNKAKKEKNDEFYTRYEDIEREVMNYRDQFEGKIVLCNCDDPEWSNFWQFFHNNFSLFKLKKLISTHYVESGTSYAMIYDGTRDKKVPLTREEQIKNNLDYTLFDICNFKESNGDFRSPECIKYLEEADIICTNPPFSLWNDFITILLKSGKKFLVIGNNNAIMGLTNEIKSNKIWLGYTSNSTLSFKVPQNYKYDEKITDKINDGNKYGTVPSVSWFTNLENNKRYEKIELYKKYDSSKNIKYDNYYAINIDKVSDIPEDYFGLMGVPITFINKYNPEQFEIIGSTFSTDRNPEIEKVRTSKKYRHCPIINGKGLYHRIIIRRKYDNEGRLVKDYYDNDGNFIGEK